MSAYPDPAWEEHWAELQRRAEALAQDEEPEEEAEEAKPKKKSTKK